MKKKFGAVFMAGLMACTLAAGFAGCGVKDPGTGTGGGNGGNNGGNNSDYNDLADVELSASGGFTMPEGGFDITKPVTITFYHTMGKVLRDELEYELGEFQKLFPNITVKHEQIGNYDDVRNQISTEIIADEQPNIAYCYPDHVALYNRSKVVQALNDFLPGGTYANTKITLEDGSEYTLGLTEDERDMFIPSFYNEGHMFGDGTQMYTMPFAKSTEVLYYNKTFFDQHKEIKIPTTWDEMETACEQILAIDPACIPFGYDSEANWFITMCEQYRSPYTVATGSNRYLFDNETNRAFVEKFKTWFDKGYFTTQAIYKSYTSGLFTSTSGQRCYMCIGSSAGAKNQQAPNTDGVYAFEAGITQIPQVDPEQPKVISQGPSVCIFKGDPQEVLASWLLVKYLTTNVEFQAAFSLDSGYIPPLNIDVMRGNPGYNEELDKANGTSGITALSALQCLNQSAAYFTSPAFTGSSKARDEVGLLMQAVFTGSKTVDKAFKDAIEECKYYD